MASLESVWLKIFRAAEHYKFLVQALTNFHPEGQSILAKANVSDHVSFSVVDAPAIPSDIPLIFGDCLQNLRSSLDYLVWELCLSAKGVPSEKNMFPICSDSGKFSDACRRRRLQGLSPAAIAEIETVQPYHVPEGYKLARLWALDELCNINKHRRILVTDFGVSAVVQNGDSASRIDTKISSTSGKVEMEGEFAAYISINEGTYAGWEIVSAALQIGKEIQEIVLPRFEQFF